MALVLTAYKAYAIETDEPLTSRFHQVLILTGTGATTDLTVDINNTAGTFWTAVVGTATGAAALKAFQQCILKAELFLGIAGDTILAKNRVTSAPSTGEYSMSVSSKAPAVTYATAGGPAAWTYVLTWKNTDGQGTVKVAS